MMRKRRSLSNFNPNFSIPTPTPPTAHRANSAEWGSGGDLSLEGRGVVEGSQRIIPTMAARQAAQTYEAIYEAGREEYEVTWGLGSSRAGEYRADEGIRA